jgi:hypothetical protein
MGTVVGFRLVNGILSVLSEDLFLHFIQNQPYIYDKQLEDELFVTNFKLTLYIEAILCQKQ